MNAVFVRIQLVTGRGCKSAADGKNHLLILLAAMPADRKLGCFEVLHHYS